MQDLDFAGIFISFIVLLFSLTVHEMAHAWTADRLGDPTARLLGRVSLNPIVHADPIGTVAVSADLDGQRRDADRLGEAGAGEHCASCAIRGATTCSSRPPGPASNLILAVFAAILLAIVPVSPQTLGESNVSVPIATLLSQARAG